MSALTAALLAKLTDPQIDAMVEAMLWAASADGDLDYSELSQLRRCLLDVDDLWLSHVDLEQRIDQAKLRVSGHSRADRLAAIKQTLAEPEQRVAVIELAALVIAADKILRTSERDLILEAADALSVEPDVVADIMARVSQSL
jgi:uncharacterized tellurite resistance protein B-like protein